jgi:ATP-binding cassette subfamily D (ALD) protein 3
MILGKQGGKGNVDIIFFKRIFYLLKIVLPSWKTPIVADFSILTLNLIIRTFLSIYISMVNGRIVEAITKLDKGLFFKRVASLGLLAFPASFVNSYIEFLNKKISLRFRSRLTTYFHESYIKDMIFYQVSNIDSRINNPDQRLTQDIEKWSASLAQLYSNFSKPLLDIILFSRKLSDLVGWRGPSYIIGWYFISALLLKFISPPFGKLTAIEQRKKNNHFPLDSLRTPIV